MSHIRSHIMVCTGTGCTSSDSPKLISAFEEELKEKTDRLNALNIELNLDEKDPSAIDTEPEQGDEPPERKNKNLER